MVKILLLSCIFSMVINPLSIAENDKDQMNIQKVIEGNSKAFADKDIEKWSSYFVQDAGFSHIGYEKLTVGFQNLKKTIANFFTKVMISDAKVSKLEIHVSGDVAWATYENSWHAKWKNSKKTRTRKGYVTLGLIKRDGTWLILRYHATAKE